MATLPSLHAIAAMVLAIGIFTAFARGYRVEIVSLVAIGLIALGLYFFPLEGRSPKDGLALAFEGFGHPALITICALMILGRGLVVTGALDPAARVLSVVWRLNHQLGLAVTLVIAFGLSMMVNDTPVLVLLIPIMARIAAGGGMAASKTLIPINAAILIGGMATTIGTSTNLLVVSIAADMGLRQFDVFEFTPIVLVAALIAFPYIWLVMPRLLPDNSVAAGHEPRQFDGVVRFDPNVAVTGTRMADMVGKLPAGVRLVGLADGDAAAESRLLLSGSAEDLIETARRLGGKLAPIWLLARLGKAAEVEAEDLVVAEMAIAPDSRLIGLTLQSSGIEGVAVLGVHRTQPVGAPHSFVSELREGDILLMQGTLANLQVFARADGLLMLDGGKDMPRTGKALVALAIMAGAVALASLGLLPIAISALGGAVLMFITGCVKFDRVGRALSAKVIVLVAASIALGKLVLVTGAADWLGQVLASGLQYLPAAGVLAAIMIFVTVLTNFASNATAATVGTPIAFSLANQLGLPAEPLVLAVLFGCNLCYATPVAYQTNAMIMAEGDYRFRDYIRTGLPLVAIMVVALSTLLTLRFDL